MTMEVKIGVQHAARELTVETNETAATVEKLVADAVASGGLLVLSDHRGRKTMVPAERIAYIEVGGGVSGQVGFR